MTDTPNGANIIPIGKAAKMGDGMNVKKVEVRLLGPAQVYYCQSRTEAIVHYQMLFENGDIICSCKGWQFAQDCWHRDEVEKMTHE